MSAFMCDGEHFAAIIGTYAAMMERSHLHEREVHAEGFEASLLERARMLARQNLRSVDHRYDGNAEAVADFNVQAVISAPSSKQIRRWREKPLAPGELFKALDCYEYQACENDDWKQTQAKDLCDIIRKMACQEVPGWEAAPWGINDPPPVRLKPEPQRWAAR